MALLWEPHAPFQAWLRALPPGTAGCESHFPPEAAQARRGRQHLLWATRLPRQNWACAPFSPFSNKQPRLWKEHLVSAVQWRRVCGLAGFPSKQRRLAGKQANCSHGEQTGAVRPSPWDDLTHAPRPTLGWQAARARNPLPQSEWADGRGQQGQALLHEDPLPPCLAAGR